MDLLEARAYLVANRAADALPAAHRAHEPAAPHAAAARGRLHARDAPLGLRQRTNLSNVYRSLIRLFLASRVLYSPAANANESRLLARS